RFVTGRAVCGCEFCSSPFADRLREFSLKVAEERKRLARSPFFAHEQKRWPRREQRNRERRSNFCLGCLSNEAIAKRAIANLIMILQEIYESEGREGAGGFAARPSTTMRRSFALIGEARAQDARKMPACIVSVIAVIAVTFAGEQMVPRV